MSPQQKIIVRELIARHPKPITKQTLITVLYGGRSDGGATSADHVVEGIISRLRTLLASYGWTINNNLGGRECKGEYRLRELA